LGQPKFKPKKMKNTHAHKLLCIHLLFLTLIPGFISCKKSDRPIGTNKLCDKSNLPVNLQNGLIAYYPFCGNAMDKSHNGHDGTVLGASLTMDRFGSPQSAYNFNGIDDRIDIGTSIQLGQPGQAITVSVWFKTKSAKPNLDLINDYDGFLYGSNGDDRLFFAGLSLDHGKIVTSLRKDNPLTGYDLFSTSDTYNDDQWHLVTSQADGLGNLKLYIDGNLNSSITYDSKTNYLNNPFWRIGAHRWAEANTYHYNFEGIIDDIFIFNRALSEMEIKQLLILK